MTDEVLVSEEVHDKFEGSQMSKAGKLAMELATERKRLKQELEELQLEVEDLRPSTPTGTIDWYVKWASMILAVAGVFLMSAGLFKFGQAAYIISSVGWVYVGSVWNDRAIMIGSAITCTAVLQNFIQSIL